MDKKKFMIWHITYQRVPTLFVRILHVKYMDHLLYLLVMKNM